MKLIKKILPIATGLSTIAITAPIIASCGSSLNMDLNYTPSIAKHEAAEFTTSDKVLEEYFNKANSNKDIIVQDYIWSNAQSLNSWISEIEPNVTNKSAKYYSSASNISLEKKSLGSKEYYCISGTFVYNSWMTETVKSTSGSKEHTSVITEEGYSTVTVKNLVLGIDYSSSSKVWSFYTTSNNNFDWETRISMSAKGSCVTTYADGTVKKSGTSNSGERTANNAYGSPAYVRWNSYNFKDVTLKQ